MTVFGQTNLVHFLLCLYEKKMTVEETSNTTEIEISAIEKIQKLHKNSQHKRLQAQRAEIE